MGEGQAEDVEEGQTDGQGEDRVNNKYTDIKVKKAKAERKAQGNQ